MLRRPTLLLSTFILLTLASAAAPVDASTDPVGPADLGIGVVARQNRERTALGLSSLQWDGGLADSARAYAAELADTGKWQHSPSDSRVGQGENLWMGTHGEFTANEMVEGWLAERKMFRAGTFPSVSTTGNWEDVGHYTQIIWHGDRHVGCGLASSPDYDYLVCRYASPGNVMGEAVIQPYRMALRA